jgi:predicted nucleotidyltransferase
MNDLIPKHAVDIRRIARSHGVVRLRVFGSLARGHGTPHSDLDLLVRMEAGRDLIDLVALKQDLEALLACSVDVVEEDGLSPYLRDRILTQAREL